MKNFVEAAGLASVVAGVALLSVPAAFIVAGVLVVAMCEVRS